MNEDNTQRKNPIICTMDIKLKPSKGSEGTQKHGSMRRSSLYTSIEVDLTKWRDKSDMGWHFQLVETCVEDVEPPFKI